MVWPCSPSSLLLPCGQSYSLGASALWLYSRLHSSLPSHKDPCESNLQPWLLTCVLAFWVLDLIANGLSPSCGHQCHLPFFSSSLLDFSFPVSWLAFSHFPFYFTDLPSVPLLLHPLSLILNLWTLPWLSRPMPPTNAAVHYCQVPFSDSTLGFRFLYPTDF